MSSQVTPRILFSFILNRDVILVSHQEENCGDIQKDYSLVLARVKDYTADIPISEECLKFTFTGGDGGNLAVHVIIEDGNVYGCLSPQDVPSYVSFLFLSKVRDRMAEQPSLVSRSYRASEYEFDRDFGPVLAQIADDFNKGRVDDKLMTVQSQVHDVKEILIANVENIIRRGELLDDLLTKTENLESQGREFRQQARALHVRVWWKNVRMWVVIGVIAAVIVTLMILYFAKVFDKKK